MLEELSLPAACCALVSLQSVLRRLRAFQCLDLMQSTIGPMVSGKVNALLLQPPEFAALVSKVAGAASDLGTLVLQPAHSKHSAGPSLKPPQPPATIDAWMQQQQGQQADGCVLQLMLSFRVLELLAAFVIYIGVHVCRLVQLQQQLSEGAHGGVCVQDAYLLATWWRCLRRQAAVPLCQPCMCDTTGTHSTRLQHHCVCPSPQHPPACDLGACFRTWLFIMLQDMSAEPGGG